MVRRTLRILGVVLVTATIAGSALANEEAANEEAASEEAGSGPAPVVLDWRAPPECPRADYVLREITRIAGGTAASTGRRVRAWATVVSTSAGYQLDLVTESEGGQGRRLLEGSSCTLVADAAAVIVALVLNPDSGAAATPPSTAGSPSGNGAVPPPGPVEPPGEAPPTVLTAQPERRVRAPKPSRPGFARPLSLRAEGLGSLVLGRLPAPSLTLGASLGVRVARLELAVVGAWGPERSAGVASGVSATFGTRSAGFRICYVVPVGEFGVGGCALAEHLWVDGRATGNGIVASPKDAQWWESWVGPRFEWRRGAWLVSGSAEIGVPWPRQAFLVEGLVAPAHEVGSVLGRLTLAGGIRF